MTEPSAHDEAIAEALKYYERPYGPIEFRVALAARGLEITEIRTCDEVLIWSGEHELYWRANRCGYTRRFHDAGRYPRAEAQSIANSCGPEKQIEIEPVTEVGAREKALREAAEVARDEDGHFTWAGTDKGVAIRQQVAREIAAAIRARAAITALDTARGKS